MLLRCLLVTALACAAVVVAWRALWFLTDDAFIAFRYVSNSYLGHGYVWNPPPFEPVEGYTSFLWIVLLDGIWRATGVLPPDAANGLSLVFALGSVLLTAWVVVRWPLNEGLRSHRAALLALVLGGIVTQRTWATWTSSGLEASMCNFWILAWFVAATRFSRARTASRGALLGSLALLLALTRPEGLLFASTTAAMVAAGWVGRRRETGALRAAGWSLAPLLGIVAHLLWRRSFYGEWLPNTYYAKHVAPWPEAGAHYLWAYVLEYALWFWAALIVWYAPRLSLLRLRSLRATSTRAGWLARWIENGMLRDMAVAAVVANFFYYTFDVGGDSFEFRVYGHLVPLMALALLWLVDRVGLRPAAALGVLALHAVLAWPIAWLHFRLSLDVPVEVAANEDEGVPITPSLPAGLRWYGEWFDATQDWLIARLLCGRHHSHRALTIELLRRFPSREHGLAMRREDIPVIALEAVGVAAWTMPYVAVIDRHGLNDYVIARMPVPPHHLRQMAHDHVAPAEYVADFKPNVRIIDRPPFVRVRKRTDGPLTTSEIVAAERKWRSRL